MELKIEKKSLIAEIKIKYLPNKQKFKDLPAVKSSHDVFRVLEQIYSRESPYHREYMFVLPLNNSNRVLGSFCLSMGGLSATIADVRVIFQVALKANATAIILAHNHPSCNLTPSPNDKSLTEKVKQAGLMLDIPLLDHLIYTPDGKYYSFADEGNL